MHKSVVLAVSCNDLFVSIIAPRYFDPHTERGCPLGQADLPALRLHECGAMILDERWTYAGVRSPFCRAYHNPDPGAAVRSGGRRWDLGPDRILILPADTSFDCIGAPGVRHSWIHFDLGSAASPSPLPRPLAVRLAASEGEQWSAFHSQVQRERGPGLARLRHACAGLLWMALARTKLADEPVASPRMRSLLTWMDQHLHSPPTLEEMATRCSLSSRAFLRWFRRETGRSPVDFMTDRRIREACRLLRFGTLSIDEIASAAGFANRHHFSRVFRRRTGRPPADYRRM